LEGGSGGDADRGDGHDTGCNREIWEGIDGFAAAEAEDRAAEEEERDVGADLGGEGEAGWAGESEVELCFQSY
jgi:hypothetical protein